MLISSALSAQTQYVPGNTSKTSVLWSYSVPGATVGIYEYRCKTLEAQKFAVDYVVDFRNMPGKVWGSNMVSCTATKGTIRHF